VVALGESDRDIAAGPELPRVAVARQGAAVLERPALAVAESAAALTFEQDPDGVAPLAGQSAGQPGGAATQLVLVRSERRALTSVAEALASMESENRERNLLAGYRRREQRGVSVPAVGVAAQALAESQGMPTRRELAQAAEYPATTWMPQPAEVAGR